MFRHFLPQGCLGPRRDGLQKLSEGKPRRFHRMEKPEVGEDPRSNHRQQLAAFRLHKPVQQGDCSLQFPHQLKVETGMAGGVLLVVRRRDMKLGPEELAEGPPASNEIAHRVAASLIQHAKILSPLLELRETLRQQHVSCHRVVALPPRPLGRRCRVVTLRLRPHDCGRRVVTFLQRLRDRRRVVTLSLHLREHRQSGIASLVQSQHLRADRVPLAVELRQLLPRAEKPRLQITGMVAMALLQPLDLLRRAQFITRRRGPVLLDLASRARKKQALFVHLCFFPQEALGKPVDGLVSQG